MRNIYTVTVRLWNGTVSSLFETSVYDSEELANEVAREIEKQNGDCFPYSRVSAEVSKAVMYESRDEVPILNTEKKEQ